MSDNPQDAWFYTREGERIGPVTFSELRVMVEETSLNPRLDMVWTHGMAEWKPAGEIEDLFDKRQVAAPPEPLAPPADPYAPPRLDSVADRMGREGEWPGVRRRGFIIATIFFPLVWNIMFSLCAGFLTKQFGVEIMGYIGLGAGLLPLLVGIYYGLKRLVNLGMSRWWYLANLVPPLGLWVGYRCFACPAGYAYHKKLDAAGVVLAIVYWLLMILTILVIVVVIAVFLGAIGDPELQERLLDALRAARDQATKP
jgi:hypothetical protein